MDELVKVALDTARPSFPATPRVVDVKHQVGTDATGDNAVRIWVILDDATPEAQLRHANFQPIADQIRGAIRKALREGPQFDLVPYVYFRLKSEQDEIDSVGAA